MGWFYIICHYTTEKGTKVYPVTLIKNPDPMNMQIDMLLD